MASLISRKEYEDLRRKMLRARFYRENPPRFYKDFLGIECKDFQKIIACEAEKGVYVMYVAARGQGKTFFASGESVRTAVLYPGSQVIIMAGKRPQGNMILEYIVNKLMPQSEPLREEISGWRISNQEAFITFKNTSVIKVVTASDSARSNHATLLICDEFRMIALYVYESVARRFLAAPRHPRYLDKPEYKSLTERNRQLLFSSAYYKSHWSYEKFRDWFDKMRSDGEKYFVCALPYQVSVEAGFLSKEQVQEEMLEETFNEISWQMEMGAEFWGGEEGSFFDFDCVNKARRLEFPLLPPSLSGLLPKADKLKMPPKRSGEIRILSFDIALMASSRHKNDATSAFLNCMLPTKAGRYMSNFVYSAGWEGLHTADQALIIRRLFDDFDADVLVLDSSGLGLGVYDAIARDMADPDTGEIYPALSCMNNPEMAARAAQGARKCVWCVKGSAQFNSDCALSLREGFLQERIRLLSSEVEGRSSLSDIDGYSALAPIDRASMIAPYMHTTLLVDELTKLKYDASGAKIKVYEAAGMRKDRYSSISYNYYVAKQLERGQRGEKTSRKLPFLFRAPKLR